MTKDRKLLAAEMWWMTGNVWADGGFTRRAEDLKMWLCLFWWAGFPVDK